MDFSSELNPLKLPDCRRYGGGNTVVYARMLWEKVYCANCGQDGGMVTADWSPFVFYLCDECAMKHGELPLPHVPEDQIKAS